MPSELAKKITGAVNAFDKGLQEFGKALSLIKQLPQGFREMTKPEEDKDD